jgi:hypothetical protein
MPEYRFYKIRKDGHVAGPPDDIFAADDATAIIVAKQRIDGQDIEIWQGPRIVAHVAPDTQ